MYSFAQRSDTRVVDEPLYGHYLRVSGARHPGRDEVMASQDCDGDAVIRDIILGPCDRPILFIKQMAHHLVGLDNLFMTKTINAFLIRDPAEMLASLANQVPDPRLANTGLDVQADLHRRMIARRMSPLVLDSREILLNPEGVLRQACDALGIEYDEGMLSWEPGQRPEDGVWAAHWYHNVHRSTGFAPYRKKSDPFPAHLETVLAACKTQYDYLYSFALKA